VCREARGYGSRRGFPRFLPAASIGALLRVERASSRDGKENAMAETWSGEYYCVKCKDKRQATGEVQVNAKGTRMAKAKCPVCGTNLNRILGKA
jgi:Domain of unknown function (DUF5679)